MFYSRIGDCDCNALLLHCSSSSLRFYFEPSHSLIFSFRCVITPGSAQQLAASLFESMSRGCDVSPLTEPLLQRFYQSTYGIPSFFLYSPFFRWVVANTAPVINLGCVQIPVQWLSFYARRLKLDIITPPHVYLSGRPTLHSTALSFIHSVDPEFHGMAATTNIIRTADRLLPYDSKSLHCVANCRHHADACGSRWTYFQPPILGVSSVSVWLCSGCALPQPTTLQHSQNLCQSCTEIGLAQP